MAKAIRIAGSQSALARRINLTPLAAQRAISYTPQAVQRWCRQGYPSKDGCLLIEMALDGLVTRVELLPALFGKIGSK
jgi:DNA-binding transcriptional regulator YdaS (Cro superfamily)